MFSESLRGVITQKFHGGFAHKRPHLHKSLKYLDLSLLEKLKQEYLATGIDPEKDIFNYSSFSLEKSKKGLI